MRLQMRFRLTDSPGCHRISNDIMPFLARKGILLCHSDARDVVARGSELRAEWLT
jgi:hypothetical protein